MSQEYSIQYLQEISNEFELNAKEKEYLESIDYQINPSNSSILEKSSKLKMICDISDSYGTKRLDALKKIDAGIDNAIRSGKKITEFLIRLNSKEDSIPRTIKKVLRGLDERMDEIINGEDQTRSLHLNPEYCHRTYAIKSDRIYHGDNYKDNF